MKSTPKNPGVSLGGDHRKIHAFGKPDHVRTLRGAPSRSRYVPHVGKKQNSKIA